MGGWGRFRFVVRDELLFRSVNRPGASTPVGANRCVSISPDGPPGYRPKSGKVLMDKDKHEPRTGDDGSQPTVSGVITSFNEEHNIADCIESLYWCDEIILVDSFSSDRTSEIAQSYDKVRFFQRRYFGAGAQKNWALQHVKHDWIFLLDADERCTPELKDEVRELLSNDPGYSAYTLNRNVYFLGKRIRYSGWQRDRVARLFRKGTAFYEKRRVHSLLHTTGQAPILKHSIDHHMVDRSFDEYAFRLARYGYWGAAQAWRDGERCRPYHVLVRPLWRFFKTYFLQKGILDGQLGLVFCLLQSYGTYMKFAILWGWKVNSDRGIEPKLPEFDDNNITWEGLERLEGSKQEGPIQEAT
jgi:glycosyltransferase involved in cell wall biosynthesis